jgi:hypothetical protein
LIELIRQKKVDEALSFAQEELAPRGEEHPEFLSELEQTMTLLAYDVDLSAVDAAAASTASGEGAENKAEPESDFIGGAPAFISTLLHPSHRQATAAQVNAAILTSQSHGPTPKLPNLLRMLAWGEQLLGERADFPALEIQVKPPGAMAETTNVAAGSHDVAML